MKSRIFIALIICCTQQLIAQNNPCTTTDSYTISPVSSDNSYSPGDILTFCYTLDNFIQEGFNWFEGILINHSNGFVASSVTPSNPTNPVYINGNPNITSCSGNGTWGFYNASNPTTPNNGTIITLFNGNTVVNNGFNNYYPGFFFEYNNGDNNPGNDYGDQNINNCSWTFCFEIEVATCGNGPLELEVLALSDGEIGGWQNGAGDCNSQTSINFIGSCEDCPDVNDPIELCATSGSLYTMAGLNVIANNNTGQWSGPSILYAGNAGVYVPENHSEGTYIYSFLDANNCVAQFPVIVNNNPDTPTIVFD